MTESSPAPDAAPSTRDRPGDRGGPRGVPRRADRGAARDRAHPERVGAPRARADMVATADWIADRLRALGATEVEVVPTPLHPIVYGRIHEAPGAPTAIVYCHYDVQPVDPLDLWEHPPFEPFVRDGRFIGRGVADDKGQLVMHLAAIEALRSVGRAPAVNLTFVFEGEEEFGSREPRGVDPREPRPAPGRRRDHQRHGVLRRQPAGDHDRPARHHVRPDRRGAVAGRPPLGRVRRRGPEPGQRARLDHRRAQGPRRAHPDPGLLRRRRPAHRRGARGDGRAPVRRRGVPRGDPRVRAGR